MVFFRAFSESGADIFVSTIMSYAMHLASAVDDSKTGVEVIHPLQLLAQHKI